MYRISLAVKKYLCKVNNHTYVLDSDTKFDERNSDNDYYPAEIVDGETPLQWQTNYYMDATEKKQIIYLDTLVIIINIEHIDSIKI